MSEQQQPKPRTDVKQPAEPAPRKTAPQRPIEAEEDESPWICRGMD
ncbi:MAG: hypothetical protein H0T79_20070 [Deltaproteobacteria bacterium]|nr:hypothetical protein [Deltaproteobacteria bacterium]